MFKKLISLILVSVTLTACGQSYNTSEEITETNTESE